MRLSGSTRVYALLGDPVSHTMPPCMHNAAFTVLGLDAVYVAIRCDAAELAGVFDDVAERLLGHAVAAEGSVGPVRGKAWEWPVRMATRSMYHLGIAFAYGAISLLRMA